MLRINWRRFRSNRLAEHLMTPMPYKRLPHSAKMAITEDGRYAAVVSLEYKQFQVYDLKNCTPQTRPAMLGLESVALSAQLLVLMKEK